MRITQSLNPCSASLLDFTISHQTTYHKFCKLSNGEYSRFKWNTNDAEWEHVGECIQTLNEGSFHEDSAFICIEQCDKEYIDLLLIYED